VFKIDNFLNPHLTEGVGRLSASLQRIETTRPSSEFGRLECGPASADFKAIKMSLIAFVAKGLSSQRFYL
jgi:hypothetical protein